MHNFYIDKPFFLLSMVNVFVEKTTTYIWLHQTEAVRKRITPTSSAFWAIPAIDFSGRSLVRSWSYHQKTLEWSVEKKNYWGLKPYSLFWRSSKMHTFDCSAKGSSTSSVKHHSETHIIRNTVMKQSKRLNGHQKPEYKKTTNCTIITKTYLYNFDPLKPHLYIVKLGFTGVFIIFLISAQNKDCVYSWEPPRRGGSNEYPQSMQNKDCVYSWEPPRRGGSNEYPQSMFWAEMRKISEFLSEKSWVFWLWNFQYICIGMFS